MSRSAVGAARGSIERYLAPQASRGSDSEAEWTPRRVRGSGRREVSLVDDDEDDDDDGNDLMDFVVDDGDDFEDDDSEDDDDDEISEAEEDNAFDEQPLNRPKRASQSGSSGISTGAPRTKKKRKRPADGELTPRSARRDQRNRTRRRELATIRDDNDLDDPTRLAREAEKLRASNMLFGADDVLNAEDNAAAVEISIEDETPLVCLNPRKEDGNPPEGELGSEGQPIFVHPAISGKLKKHQVKGAQFLWSHVSPEPSGFGCVLADFMGLGKTLQVITVVQAFLALKRRRSSDGSLVNRHKHVLILAPTICVRNWEAEVVKWLGKKDARRLGVHTLESSREKKVTDRVEVVKQWHRRGGLLIMGYELYRILVLQSSGDEKIAAGNAKHAHLIREVYKYISDPGPDLIVLDEGHRVRDHKSKLVKALSHVKTSRRIILTGYPLQNHLEEYWTMVNFARPDYLGSLEDFKNRFVNPIENGQCVDSTEGDRKLARQRAFILTNELKTLVLRRDQEFLFRQLPPKKEWVLLCKLTEPQATLYRRFLQYGVPKRGELMPGVGGKIDVLGGYHISLAISNHPDVLQETYHQLEEALRKGTLTTGLRKNKARGNDDDDEDLLQYLAVDMARANGAAAQSRRVSTTLSDEDSDSILEALDAPSGNRGGPSRAAPGVEHRLSFARDFMHQYIAGMLESSGKMQLLMEILRECKAIGDRVILFSQSIPTLNTVEKMIAYSNRREKRHSSRLTYLRIDGSTPQQERFRMIGQFNDLEEDADLIMISTKAGGEGVNLCAGNRIVIFDVCWNPCNDSQSMCRSYRFGQTKPVFVYRFVSAGTMEKKVYDLQIRKEGVAKRIVDEKALERKFKTADLQNYFNLDDFEQSMQQQSTVLERTMSVKAPTDTGDGASSDASSTATDSTLETPIAPGSMVPLTSAPGGDFVLEKVLNKIQDERLDWVLDWFEQETMFEETIDDNCTEAEQEEITSSYRYYKAVRGMNRDAIGLGSSRDTVLVIPCTTCHIPNEIYPEEITRVPVPKYIECRYCKRPTPTVGAVTGAQSQANAAALAAAGGVPLPGYPGGRGYLPYTTNTSNPGGALAHLDTGSAATPASTQPLGPPDNWPPHIRALHIQQQQQALQLQQMRQQDQVARSQSELLRRQLENERRELEKKRKERETWKLGDRTLLVLRRGISKVQELKRMAAECGATLAIEVNPQLTDIVSGMSVNETLQWLKLTKLPRDVAFHNDAWLRDEIAKEKGLPRASQGQSGAAPTSAPSKPAAQNSSRTPDQGTSSANTSHDTIAIDLSDSDDDADADGDSRMAAAPPHAAQGEETDSDEDFIEIL